MFWSLTHWCQTYGVLDAFHWHVMFLVGQPMGSIYSRCPTIIYLFFFFHFCPFCESVNQWNLYFLFPLVILSMILHIGIFWFVTLKIYAKFFLVVLLQLFVFLLSFFVWFLPEYMFLFFVFFFVWIANIHRAVFLSLLVSLLPYFICDIHLCFWYYGYLWGTAGFPKLASRGTPCYFL